MSELGQHLKEAREQKDISLDDLQQTTKIQKRYLIAIEEGRFDSLPGLFYARAFIKTYAEAIGLDPEPLFDQFRGELPNPQRESVQLPSRTERARVAPKAPRKRPKGSPFVSTLLAIVFIAIIVIVIYLFNQGNIDPEVVEQPDTSENVEGEFSETLPEEEEPVADEEEEPVADEDEQADVEPEPEPDSISLNFIESQGNVSYYELVGGTLEAIRIEVSGTSYIDVKNALGKTLYLSNKGENTTLDFSSEEEILLNFGASTNVNLFIGETEVEFPLDIPHQKINITVVNEE
ncbi:helix-turn-helix domain-containing protein [Bacillus sp. YZJH907-2]|uniref:Helix-turn-helix domain-containing protein n=1 Tax=Halalkalibacter suaedae TaxID=2822140 RepID=A0A941APN1_9BACI|nr:helix-turn-helix domain-containing protein [Bacillus suaedae]MBP3951971.1 helix-turn-helix domain-containing protein [Bacillus suaedae]